MTLMYLLPTCFIPTQLLTSSSKPNIHKEKKYPHILSFKCSFSLVEKPSKAHFFTGLCMQKSGGNFRTYLCFLVAQHNCVPSQMLYAQYDDLADPKDGALSPSLLWDCGYARHWSRKIFKRGISSFLYLTNLCIKKFNFIPMLSYLIPVIWELPD